MFGGAQADTAEEVLVNWEALKRTEKGQRSTADAIEAVPHTLPALWRAEKVQKKAKKAGFDWPDAAGALDKLSEELDELKEAIDQNTNVEEELGDLLFAAVNVARFVKADPEQTLTAATEKFISRFAKVEELARQQGRDMAQMPLLELDRLWEQVKLT